MEYLGRNNIFQTLYITASQHGGEKRSKRKKGSSTTIYFQSAPEFEFEYHNVKIRTQRFIYT